MFIAERRPRGKAHEAEGQVASITGGAHGMGEADAQPFVKQHFDATMIFAMQTTTRGYEAWTLV